MSNSFKAALAAILIAISFTPSLAGLTVPNDECPSSVADTLRPNPCGLSPFTCIWEEGDVKLIAQGTPSDMTGDEVLCQNCAGCSPRPADEKEWPPALTCDDKATISYTNTWTWSITGGIEAELKIVKAKVESEFNYGKEKTYTKELSCGPVGGVPPCRIFGFALTLQIYKDAKMQMTGKYHWEQSVTGPCADWPIGKVISEPCRGDDTATYTLTGARYSGVASCKSTTWKWCP